MKEKTKCLFNEIPIGSEFSIKNLNTVLIKIDDGHYCIKGQKKLWRQIKNVEYLV